MIPGFADIFRNNSVKNGLLTIELDEPEVEELFQLIARNKGVQMTVNLEEQRITLHTPEEISFHFEIEPGVKEVAVLLWLPLLMWCLPRLSVGGFPERAARARGVMPPDPQPQLRAARRARP